MLGIVVDLNDQPIRAGGNRSLTIAPTYSVDARGAQMNEKQFGAVLRQNNDDLVKQIKKAVPGWVVDYQQRFLG